MSNNTFHVALHVSDLPRAIARYEQILGIPPVKVAEGYAKFEIADPPVVLSLNVGGTPGTVGHLGIRYSGIGEVATELVRSRREGLEPRQQDGVTCCYARADKYWVNDADGIPWEIYAVLEDLPVSREDACSNGCAS